MAVSTGFLSTGSGSCVATHSGMPTSSNRNSSRRWSVRARGGDPQQLPGLALGAQSDFAGAAHLVGFGDRARCRGPRASSCSPLAFGRSRADQPQLSRQSPRSAQRPPKEAALPPDHVSIPRPRELAGHVHASAGDEEREYARQAPDIVLVLRWFDAAGELAAPAHGPVSPRSSGRWSL